jgi:hypothetical protein
MVGHLSENGTKHIPFFPDGLAVPGRIVTAFSAEVAALEKEYPELVGFETNSRDVESFLAIKFQQESTKPDDGDAAKSTPCTAKLATIEFIMTCANDEPPSGAWNRDEVMKLGNLNITLYSRFVLPDNTMPGLRKKLQAIFDKYRTLLRELNNAN